MSDDIAESLEKTLDAIQKTMGGGGIACVSDATNEASKAVVSVRTRAVMMGSFYVRIVLLVVIIMILLIVQDCRNNQRVRWIIRIRRCLVMSIVVAGTALFILMFGVRLSTIPTKILYIH